MSHHASQFLGLDNLLAHYDTAKVVIIPAPFEASTSYQKGTANGPAAIIEASCQVELYDIEMQKDFSSLGIHTAEALPLRNAPAKEAFNILYKKAKSVLKDEKFPVMLGGEHAISYGLFKALLEKYPNLSIFHIDAHTDMRSSYEENEYSHACIMYVMRKECPRSVSIGIRSMCEEEANYVKKNKVPVYYDYQTHEKGFKVKELIKPLTDHVFLTIDVDGFSPAIVPTTGTPEPGGLKWYETLSILKHLFKHRNVVGMDVVEVMPIPNLVHGDFSIAKLIYKCIGYKYFQS